MASISDRIKAIKEQKIGNSGKNVLLVEGSDDVHAMEQFLAKTDYVWNDRWIVTYAGKKTDVLDIISKEPEWLGLVDRDEWSSERIEQLTSERNNLLFLPRYCIENYLILPEELWQALPEKQQSRVTGGVEAFSEQLLNDIDRWVAHGALWQVVNPLWEGLRSLGFKEALLDPAIATDDQAIQQKLDEWHHFLEPAAIFATFQARLLTVNELSVNEKLALHVHGKYFFQQVVNPLLDRLLGQKNAKLRQKAIFRFLPASDEFLPLWEKMGLVH